VSIAKSSADALDSNDRCARPRSTWKRLLSTMLATFFTMSAYAPSSPRTTSKLLTTSNVPQHSKSVNRSALPHLTKRAESRLVVWVSHSKRSVDETTTLSFSILSGEVPALTPDAGWYNSAPCDCGAVGQAETPSIIAPIGGQIHPAAQITLLLSRIPGRVPPQVLVAECKRVHTAN